MLLPGRGRANDTAIVILPTSEGAHFTVLDGNGEVFGDTLPFLPHEYHLGRRADGTVLAGFGDLRLNSRHFRDRDTPEPVRVYMDGQVIYESDKTWRFSVAPDGSSFYVHEPLAGGASRLIVHNLDELAERHFDMDRRYTPSNDYESGFGVSRMLEKRQRKYQVRRKFALGRPRSFPYPWYQNPALRYRVASRRRPCFGIISSPLATPIPQDHLARSKRRK